MRTRNQRFYKEKESIMAAPIKITPVLSGAASTHFNASLKANSAKVSANEKARITNLVEKIMSKSK